MRRLSDDERTEFRKKHLPYVIYVMRGHKRLCNCKRMQDDKGGYNDDPCILEASFVGSLAAGRMLLHFLGVDVDGGQDRLKRHVWRFEDDLNMEGLGGSLADLDRLNAEESTRALLVGFLKMASKAAAHMTIPVSRPWRDTWEAFDMIEALLRECWWKDGVAFPP